MNAVAVDESGVPAIEQQVIAALAAAGRLKEADLQRARQLHAEQLRIMDRQGQCLVLPEDADITVIEKAAEVIAHG